MEKRKEPTMDGSVMDGSLMDFETDRSTAADRKRVVVSYLLKQALAEQEKTEEEIPTDLIGSFYF